MSELKDDYKLVLGLEIHLHLNVSKKMFCKCSADIYNSDPNTHTCPVCLGLPGALPVPNLDAVNKTQLLGLALNCHLRADSRFDRKHYFYPDLPKGYQISQYKFPLCEGGFVKLDSGTVIELERIHLEEDTAKSTHEKDKTLIDFNMSSVPLVEIVTKPVIKSVEDAVEFCKKIQTIVRFLEIGDVDMEKGQMRLEPNISMRTPEMESRGELPKYKVEIKNINSFRFMEKAINAEMKRQSELLLSGETPAQENRGFVEAKGTTVSQRSKEDAHDYRYFPEPDIPPMIFSEEYFDELKKVKKELPDEMITRLIQQHNLNHQQAFTLVYSLGKEVALRFEDIVAKGVSAEKAANLLINKKEFLAYSVEEFVKKVEESETQAAAGQVDEGVILDVLAKNADAVTSYKNGKTNVLQYLVGQVMREVKGKVDANTIRELLLQKLK